MAVRAPGKTSRLATISGDPDRLQICATPKRQLLSSTDAETLDYAATMSFAKSTLDALQEALALHKQGQLEEAGQRYREVLEAEPNHPSALHLMGLLAVQQEKPEEALDWLSKALAANPRSPVCHSDLGLVLCGLERFDAAESAFRRALELQPQFPEALHNWGNLHREFGFLDRAASCYEQALAQRTDYPEASESLRALQKTRENLAAFVQAMKQARTSSPPERPDHLERLKLERRELFPLVLNELGLKGVGAEVGVQQGKFSERILRVWEGRALYSIDPWREFSATEYADVSNVSQAKQDGNYLETLRRLMPFHRRSIVWRLTSREAADLLPDQNLDFAYIDADHSYRGVSEDIRLWYPKVKPGGVLAGHDYCTDGQYWLGDFGVQHAVNEFVEASKLDLFLCDEPEGGFLTWVVIKR
jgi:tetratricopeptide (TPR) repeat protein